MQKGSKFYPEDFESASGVIHMNKRLFKTWNLPQCPIDTEKYTDSEVETFGWQCSLKKGKLFEDAQLYTES